MKKILLVSSSSGGHVYPCLCCGEILKSKGHQISYLGIKGQFEEKVIKDINLVDIPSSFKKSLSINELKKLKNSYPIIKKLINEHDVIIAFGGFITFVISIFNILIKKKLFIHEQNVILGDSIKFAYLFSNKLLLSFDNKLTKLPKSLLIGNPTTLKIYHRNDINIKKPKIMFIFGSLSSLTCLKVVKEFLLNTSLNNQILVVTGFKNCDLFSNINKKNIIFKTKIDMKEELKEYDLVFTRGGACTLLELVKSGVEIVCIPSPYVKKNHQLKNAKYFQKKGVIRIISEKEFNKDKIETIITNLQRINNYVFNEEYFDRLVEEVNHV